MGGQLNALRLVLAVFAAATAAAADDVGFTALAPASAARVALPDAVPGEGLALSWPERHGRWIEGFHPAPAPVAGLAPGAAVLLRLPLWCPAGNGVRQFSVRLADAHHEIWQWSVAVAAPPAGGRVDLAVPLALERSAGHWGGDGNGIPDPPFSLSGYGVSFADERIPAGQVVLGPPVIDPLPAVSVATERFPFLLAPGGSCELALANRQDRELAVEIAATATDWAGARLDSAGRVVLAPQGTARLQLRIGERPGIRTLAWTMRVDGIAVPGAGAVAVTAPLPPGGRDGFRFGICSHPERRPADDQEREMRAAAAAGATVMRCGEVWSTLEPKPGAWRWDGFDRLLGLAEAQGLELQPLLGFCVAHAAPAAAREAQAEGYRLHQADAWKHVLFAPPAEAPWRAYVAAVAARYRGRIRMYEVWNEPDLGFFRGTTDEYIRLLRSAGDELHRADPAAELLTGGFATVLDHPGRARNPDLQERVLAEAADAFDVHAVHQHGPFAEFRGAVEGELARIRARMPVPRPLYFNETAMCAYGGSPAAEREQAVELVKKMAWVVSRGALGYTWYDLCNDGGDPRDPEQNYGLLTRDFRPKPAFPAYTELVRRLRGTRHLGDLDLGPGRYGLVFAAPDRRVAVLWREDRNQPDEPLALRLGAGARQCDLQGGPEPLVVEEGIALLHLQAEPRYLELEPGEAMPVLAGPLLRLRGATTVMPGRPAAFTVAARNPLSRPIALHLAWRGRDGEEHSDLALAPGADGEAAITVPVGAANQQAVEVGYVVAGGAWRGTLRQPLLVARDVAAQPPEGREPDLVLAARSDVVSLCEADPALAAQVWRGPDDLSARLWWWQADAAFHIQVDVRDDVHVQRESPAEQWKGDGIQFALRIPRSGSTWELGAARRSDDGRVMRACWQAPAGDSGAAEAFTAAVDPIPGGLRYRIDLPCARFGLDPQTLRDGFRFNLIVNDNDGNLRESFVRIAPGIGERKDPAAFPLFRVPDRG